MGNFSFSPFALGQIDELPRDAVLLKAVWRHLEWAAADPETRTEFPPPFPHRQDRRLLQFRASDTNRNEWAFSVLFAVGENELVVVHFAFNQARHYTEFE